MPRGPLGAPGDLCKETLSSAAGQGEQILDGPPRGVIGREENPGFQSRLTSASAFSSQDRISISRYIAAAIVKCSHASRRLPTRP